MKKPKKSQHKISYKIEAMSVPVKPQEQSQEQLPNTPKRKKTFFWAIRGALLVISLVAVGWYLVHRESDSHPFLARHFKIININEMYEDESISKGKTIHAMQLLRKGIYQQGVDELIDAINICPVNTDAYVLLVKAYLLTGQELKALYVIDRAGDSFADLNQIIGDLDDADFNSSPWVEPKEDIYLATFPENKKMVISFMFDDGEKNIYDHLNIFEKYGFRATISVIAGFIGRAPQWGTWEEWRDASKRGFGIADHSMHHRSIYNLSDHDLSLEIDQADHLIEKKIGHDVAAFVFPEGQYSDNAVRHAFGVNDFVRTPEFLRSVYNRSLGIVYGGPFFSLKTANRLVDIGIKRRLWIIAKAHGITTKHAPWSYKPIAPSLLDAHLSYIHSKSNDVYVDTFSNIIKYLLSRNKTTIEIKAFSLNSADFVLHGDDTFSKRITPPLTVVLKAPLGADVSAQTADGRKLKTWACAIDKVCVDVDVYNENIHVQ